MKRVVALLALTVGLTVLTPDEADANNWVNQYHWPRRFDTGSTATETLIYYQNDVVGYQGDYVAWSAYVWSRSPAVRVKMVDTCPAGRNCIVWQTAEVSPWAGTAGVLTGSNRHILKATVNLDPDTGRAGSVKASKYIACHEGGHGKGGALWGEQHVMCNRSWWDPYYGYPTGHDYAGLAKAYDHHG